MHGTEKRGTWAGRKRVADEEEEAETGARPHGGVQGRRAASAVLRSLQPGRRSIGRGDLRTGPVVVAWRTYSARPLPRVVFALGWRGRAAARPAHRLVAPGPLDAGRASGGGRDGDPPPTQAAWVRAFVRACVRAGMRAMTAMTATTRPTADGTVDIVAQKPELH